MGSVSSLVHLVWLVVVVGDRGASDEAAFEGDSERVLVGSDEHPTAPAAPAIGVVGQV